MLAEPEDKITLIDELLLHKGLAKKICSGSVPNQWAFSRASAENRRCLLFVEGLKY